MDRSEKAIFTNMCMVYDNDENVLVLERKDTDWNGITFPGGHVEKGESFTDSVIREVYEETGLQISNPQLCGVKQWPNRDGSRYVVFFYKTNKFVGDIIASEEGDVYWVKLKELIKMNLADGMDRMLQVFLEDDISEYFWYQSDGKWIDVLK
jgi:8-oxo-dGTP diphosphatase